jgi:hypothetical protein
MGEAVDGDHPPDSSADPMQDAAAWQALELDEQDAILSEGLADLTGATGSGHWRHLSADVQAETRRAIERDDAALSEAEAAMQEAVSQTWTAELFAAHDNVPTVPLPCRELSEREQQILMDGFQVFHAIEDQADGPDDIDALDVNAEYFDSIEQFEDWLLAFLGDVVTDDAFDETRFRSGAGLRSGTRGELLAELVFRYQQEAERAQKFRKES